MNATEPLHLDVRPLFEQGVEPFPAILEAKAKLVPGQTLVLLAPFDPKPLYGLFESEGFTVSSRQRSDGPWEIRFAPGGGVAGAGAKEMDLRAVPPSEWIERALDALGRLGRDEKLVLHTRAQPDELFRQIDPDAVDYDCEQVVDDHWVSHLWRLTA